MGGFTFSGSSLDLLKIESSGNVGIGTPTPTVALDIVGALKVTDYTTTRNSLQLPTYDTGTLIANLDSYIESGWNIANSTATNNPEADYTYVNNKMVNTAFGIQDVEVRSTGRTWRRYRASNSWGGFRITNEPIQGWSPTIYGDTGSGATLNIMVANYKRLNTDLCFVTFRGTVTSKGTAG